MTTQSIPSMPTKLPQHSGQAVSMDEAIEAVKQIKICQECGRALTGQFVRALSAMWHLDCFRCRDCGQNVATKFFPYESPNGSIPLCERDYFARLSLLCHACGEALRGSYVHALNRKYHVHHFTCSVCPTTFGPSESYYEHNGDIFCHYHYSILHATLCSGCSSAILKQYAEIHRNGVVEQWHPECYMIHKSWNLRLSSEVDITPPQTRESMARLTAAELKTMQTEMEEQVACIWTVLSAFEESSAGCIREMLIHVSNGENKEGVHQAQRFIGHVEVLFKGIDAVERELGRMGASTGMQHNKEPKVLCKKIVTFFSLLSHTQESKDRRAGLTQDLLSLVTHLAHCLKTLIRIALNGALKLERKYASTTAINGLLNHLMVLGEDGNVRPPSMKLDEKPNGEGKKLATVHLELDSATQLEQYIYLLRMALRRLRSLLNVEEDAFLDAKSTLPPTNGNVRAFPVTTSLEAIQKEANLHASMPTNTPPDARALPVEADHHNHFNPQNPQNLHINPPPYFQRDSTTSVGFGSVDLPSFTLPPLDDPTVQETPLSGVDPPMSFLQSPTVERVASRLSKSTINRSKTPLCEVPQIEVAIIKHLAILLLQPILKEFYAPDELIEYIESRKGSLWSRFVSSFKTNKKPKPKDATFGVPLEEVVLTRGIDSTLGSSEQALRIPRFVNDCISSMRAKDLNTEGIFRKNGNIKRAKSMADSLDRDPNALNVQDEDVIQCAAMLKRFLRDLPDPLFTFQLSELFIVSQKLKNDADKIRATHLLFCLLPKAHRDLVEFLFCFLVEVAHYANMEDENKGNKMDLNNIATVITPNVLYCKKDQMTREENTLSIKAVHMILSNLHNFRLVPDEVAAAMSRAEAIQNSIQDLSKKEFMKRCEALMEMTPARHHNVHVTAAGGSDIAHQARSAEIQNSK